ncbi:hypothetical protein CANTEDRAFT_113881 [Yamadazyma tenuis ATCC 10573]|uniref:Uncharacterized protein n=1 Tax=Candida tenuis (strain ATCC 10573 / BCRC 21748 / CBS 615 / JCM 9827 / NBRC 10315 / NRRL Y-1498 / VKM Y-70) TaxID=590646 RepID=G3B4R6_CANTC|nr:uncharacterized protein CANTEDRAFT_113881 [Yamadazyma tenuis ATCC 10573]EGV63854.1 hypothetical protein CANTEDRAFT_113881 [Yamadazyma tenuis ATCC 10573]
MYMCYFYNRSKPDLFLLRTYTSEDQAITYCNSDRFADNAARFSRRNAAALVTGGNKRGPRGAGTISWAPS